MNVLFLGEEGRRRTPGNESFLGEEQSLVSGK